MTNLLARAQGGPRDHRSAVPLYVQLRERLRAQIEAGDLEPGDRLPTEVELEERYEVSRSTIRQAIGDLQADGLVQRVQGKGTFVASPAIQHGPELKSFTELLHGQGYDPTHRPLDSTIVTAPDAMCHELGIDEGTSCRYLERLLVADDRPVGVSRTWLPLPVLGAADQAIAQGTLAGGSLYRLLAESSPDLAPRTGSETILPALAGGEEARLLGCEVGTALLSIRRCTWTATGQPLEWTHLLFVPGRYEYRVELQRSGATGGARG